MRLSEVRAIARAHCLRVDKTQCGCLFLYCPRTLGCRSVDGVIGWKRVGRDMYEAY